jgi:predicted nucleic acid-binding protein
VTVFLDTGFFVARLRPRDQWHQAAVNAPVANRYITSADVIGETLGLIQGRGALSVALAFLDQVTANDEITIIHADSQLRREAWKIYRIQAASGASPVDCLSFAIMHRFGITQAFAFDHHFRVAGFLML